MEAWIHDFLQWLALPQFGLSTVFVVALISATLLPLGSEPAVVGLLQLNPALFWPAILTATAGNQFKDHKTNQAKNQHIHDLQAFKATTHKQ